MLNYTAKCGCNCLHCPTYKDNIRTTDERLQCSSAWKNYLNIRLSPEKLRACDGCSISDNERKVYYLNCKVRKCAMINEVENCAYCKGFPCDELLNIHSLQKITSRQEFIDKTNKTITEEDFQRFIEPYAGFKHLNNIRQTLTNKDLKDYKVFASKNKFTPVRNLSEKSKGIQVIHSLLTNIAIEQNISYARLQTVKKKREQLIKILWTIGLYGTLTDENSLELDSMTFLSQKIIGTYNTLSGYLKDLEELDIHCKIIPLVEKGWLTPMGGLRKDGWKFTLRFGNSLGGSETLKTLKKFTKTLNTRYVNKAFKMFNMADVNVM